MRLLIALLAVASTASAAPAPAPGGWRVPVSVKKMPNGLTVVVSEDHSAPTFGLSVAYRIGFRLEPKGRTGFAHLFEHLMFEGTPVAPKGTFDRVIEGGGGFNNGSTRPDYTNYIASAPISALDAILWLEADRMKTLDFSEKNLANQREVVKEEIRVNVLNRPYGLFFWTDLWGKAFDKWENAHDGYGSFADLDAAKLEDARTFYGSFYGPNNAVLAVAGDVTPAEVFAKVETYFKDVAARPTPNPPDVTEGSNKAERTAVQSDTLAEVPAVAIAWKLPGRVKDHIAAAVLGDLLAGSGEASRLFQSLVKGKGTLLNVDGGYSFPIGSPWEVNGPTVIGLFALYKPNTNAKAVTAAVQAEIDAIAKKGVPADELERTKTKLKSGFYSGLEMPIDRANALALQQLFTGDAAALNDVPAAIDAVTSDDVARVARTYLTVANRTVIDRKPAPAGKDDKKAEKTEKTEVTK